MNAYRKFTKIIVLCSLLFAGAASAESFWYEYRRLAGTPSAPYITYAVYKCWTTVSGGSHCQFSHTTVGMNPDL
jgi:hypothetical protein